MTRYIAQVRLIKLPDPDAEPDRWSSAESTMTVAEGSAPFDSDDDEDAILTSTTYMDALAKTVALMANTRNLRAES